MSEAGVVVLDGEMVEKWWNDPEFTERIDTYRLYSEPHISHEHRFVLEWKRGKQWMRRCMRCGLRQTGRSQGPKWAGT